MSVTQCLAELINDAIQRNKAAGYHTVISSTYHSMERVLKACHIGGYQIDCHINDEPQKLVTDQFKELSDGEFTDAEMEEFSANIQRYAKRVYSVTATPKHTLCRRWHRDAKRKTFWSSGI